MEITYYFYYQFPCIIFCKAYYLEAQFIPSVVSIEHDCKVAPRVQNFEFTM